MSCRKSHPSPTLLPKQSQPYSYSILSSHFTPAWEPSMLYPQSLKRLFYTLLACIQCHQSQYPIQIFDSMGQSLTVFNSMGQSLTRWVGCLGDDHDQQGSFFLCFSFLICSATCCLLTGMLFELCYHLLPTWAWAAVYWKSSSYCLVPHLLNSTEPLL